MYYKEARDGGSDGENHKRNDRELRNRYAHKRGCKMENGSKEGKGNERSRIRCRGKLRGGKRRVKKKKRGIG